MEGGGQMGASAARSLLTAPKDRCCPVCGNQLHLRSPHVAIDGGAVRVYCSETCRDRARSGQLDPVDSAPPERRSRARWVAAMFLAAGAGGGAVAWQRVADAPPAVAVEPPPPRVVVPDIVLPLPPPLSPNELYWTPDVASDRWLHPLAGPIRRMPVRDSRVFGAERPGDRPPECHRGHCGVDIGGDVWGEPVLASHDGVVDRVQRGPNDAHGGLYVRLAHRGGSVFTQYFHLAAIPRQLEPGAEVSAGDVIGLLGDSGVHRSGPHLHFTISVVPGPDLPEQFIDPEPLIALWPVSIPIFGTTGSVAVAHVVPGRPVGRARRAPRARARRVRAAEASPDAGAAEPVSSPD